MKDSMKKNDDKFKQIEVGNLLRTCESQSAVIALQNEIIDELFQIVALHVSAKEMYDLPALDKMGKLKNMSKNGCP